MRHFINIIESAAPYIYHGTGKGNLDGIRATGLTPSSPPMPEGIWPEFDEEDEDDMPEEAYEQRLFATPNFDAAAEYAEGTGDGVVLRFVETPDWTTGYSEMDTYLYSTQPVPASQIEFLENGEWRPLLG